MKLAAIDIGSNSIHMVIVEVAPDGSLRVNDREKDIVGLGRGTLERNFLEERTMDLGAAALSKYEKLARRHGVDQILAVATSAVREALNGGDFIERIRRETGIDVRVVTAVEEARLIGLAVREGIDIAMSSALVIDIGGGSIEMILLDRGKVVMADSFKLGVIRLAERFLPSGSRLTRSSRKELLEHLRAVTGDFVERARKHGFESVIGTSGTILALGALATLPRDVGAAGHETLNGRSVPLAALAAEAERVADMTARERSRLPGIDEPRADTIAVGAVAIVDLLERLGSESILLCDRALREGILADYLERNRELLGRFESHPGLRARSVVELGIRYGYDARHAVQIGRFATQLFDRTQALHGLKKEYRVYLEHAAVLHDVGTHIAFEGHHRHGYYLVKNGGLRGFRPEEVELIAGLVLYHRKRGPKKSDPCMRALARKDRKALRVLAGLLRMADGLDRSHFQVVRDLNVRVAGKVVSIYVDASEDPELEVWAAHRKGRLFERATGAELRFVLKNARASSWERPRATTRKVAAAASELADREVVAADADADGKVTAERVTSSSTAHKRGLREADPARA